LTEEDKEDCDVCINATSPDAPEICASCEDMDKFQRHPRAVFFVQQTVTTPQGEYIVCIAKENEKGYYLTDWKWGKDFEVATRLANERNTKGGIDEKEAHKIIMSTIFASPFHYKRDPVYNGRCVRCGDMEEVTGVDTYDLVDTSESVSRTCLCADCVETICDKERQKAIKHYFHSLDYADTCLGCGRKVGEDEDDIAENDRYDLVDVTGDDEVRQWVCMDCKNNLVDNLGNLEA